MSRADRGTTGGVERSPSALLATASDHLEDALERVDLEDDPELAERVIEAIEATDEAATLASEKDNQRRQAGTLSH
ncbi:hypothetical protein ACFQDG_01035 [Natronoarchaeum mannanilyticum]|uniref:Uncharacterized protein n=1 Tax=Natronoarchaeum mannanilyticum TaxID=926360 RepID=A0AAV3T895_9EURY